MDKIADFKELYNMIKQQQKGGVLLKIKLYNPFSVAQIEPNPCE